MSISLFLSISLILMVIIVLTYLIIQITQFFAAKTEEYISENQYLVYVHVFETSIETYKQSKFIPNQQKLQKTHDLDPQSPSNSIKKYNTEVNTLINKSIEDFLNNYLSSHTKDTLLKYYSINHIILQIYQKLSSEV